MERRSNFLSVMDFNVAFGVFVAEKMTSHLDDHVSEIFKNKNRFRADDIVSCVTL